MMIRRLARTAISAQYAQPVGRAHLNQGVGAMAGKQTRQPHRGLGGRASQAQLRRRPVAVLLVLPHASATPQIPKSSKSDMFGAGHPNQGSK